MSRHLHRDLDQLKRSVLGMGSMVEEATNQAIIALIDRREDIARAVAQSDGDIDRQEVAIEEDCLKVLALHQPVAIDLRFIVAVMKVNNDLERMGDLAMNIAERAAFLASEAPIPIPTILKPMAEAVRGMLRDSLTALVDMDGALARDVCKRDDTVDDFNADMFEHVQESIREDPSRVAAFVQVLSASRHLERIADHATNIAEDVIFMVEGEIIRHSRMLQTGS
jgi:phosphate transport system protein